MSEKYASIGRAFERLVSIMSALRQDSGCPWDREQTHESLTPYLIEEAYEVLESIEEKEYARLCEELGDLLLQIVFHAQIAWEEGLFTIDDVIREIVEKMIRRHPHVFGDSKVESAEQVVAQWEEIKLWEKENCGRSSLTNGIPRTLPALLQAERIQGRIAEVGFEWENFEQVADKVREEMDEFLGARASGDLEKIRDEVGDLLFAVVNMARWCGVNSEGALRETVNKFIRRFKHFEADVARQNIPLSEMNLEDMERIWEQAKHVE